MALHANMSFFKQTIFLIKHHAGKALKSENALFHIMRNWKMNQLATTRCSGK